MRKLEHFSKTLNLTNDDNDLHQRSLRLVFHHEALLFNLHFSWHNFHILVITMWQRLKFVYPICYPCYLFMLILLTIQIRLRNHWIQFDLLLR